MLSHMEPIPGPILAYDQHVHAEKLSTGLVELVTERGQSPIALGLSVVEMIQTPDAIIYQNGNGHTHPAPASGIQIVCTTDLTYESGRIGLHLRYKGNDIVFPNGLDHLSAIYSHDGTLAWSRRKD